MAMRAWTRPPSHVMEASDFTPVPCFLLRPPPFPKALGPGACSRPLILLRVVMEGCVCRTVVPSPRPRITALSADRAEEAEGGCVSVHLLVGPAHWGSHPAVPPVGRTSDPESIGHHLQCLGHLSSDYLKHAF